MLKFSIYLNRRVFVMYQSDGMKAQADLNLRWAYMSEGMFSDLATHIWMERSMDKITGRPSQGLSGETLIKTMAHFSNRTFYLRRYM